MFKIILRSIYIVKLCFWGFHLTLFKIATRFMGCLRVLIHC